MLEYRLSILPLMAVGTALLKSVFILHFKLSLSVASFLHLYFLSGQPVFNPPNSLLIQPIHQQLVYEDLMEASVESLTEVMVHNICCSNKETNKEKFPIYLLHFYKGTQTVSRHCKQRLITTLAVAFLQQRGKNCKRSQDQGKLSANFILLVTICLRD